MDGNYVSESGYTLMVRTGGLRSQRRSTSTAPPRPPPPALVVKKEESSAGLPPFGTFLVREAPLDYSPASPTPPPPHTPPPPTDLVKEEPMSPSCGEVLVEQLPEPIGVRGNYFLYLTIIFFIFFPKV